MAYRWVLLAQLARILSASLLSVFLCTVVAHAQNIDVAPRRIDSPLNRPLSELHHTSYADHEDIPGAVYTAAQAADGFLWLGSSKGLVRFDGAHFDSRFAHSLPPGRIVSIYCDDGGDLWVGYQLGGLSHIHGDSIINYKGGVDIPDGTLFSILRGPDGHLWIATTKGVEREVAGRWEPIHGAAGYDGHQPEGMQMIDGKLWILDEAGAWYFDAHAQRFQRMDRAESIDKEWRKIGSPPRLFDAATDGAAMIDSSGALWVAVSKGLERSRWLIDEQGQTQRVTEVFTHANGLSSDDVDNFLEDREGNVWVFTSAGIDQFRATKLRPVVFPNLLVAPSMVPWKGNAILVPNRWQSPFIVDGSTLKTASDIPSGETTVTRDRHGSIWMAGFHGLFVYADDRLKTIALPPELKDVGTRFQALALDDDDALWVSAPGYGLYRFKDGNWSKQDGQGFPEGAAFGVLNDGQGRLWLAYPHNTLLVMAHGKIKRYGPKDGLQAGNVMAVNVHGLHVWIGGDNGLFTLNGDHFAKILGKGDEAFRGLTGIVETANGDLWLNGLDGAYRILAADIIVALHDATYRVPFQLFDQNDGRIGTPDSIRGLPTLLAEADGKLWFSTTSSVSWINPRDLLKNTTPPTVSIDAISMGDMHYPATGKVELPALTRQIEFGYTAASMTQPERVRFRYRLDGVDDVWQEVGYRRHAFYTNLSPGDYRFHVQAVNEDGVQSVGDTSFAFSILPAWYQTLVFKAICAILAVMALFFTFRFLRARVLSRLRARMQIRYDEREAIARDLHDTLLQSTQGLALQLSALSKEVTDSRTKQALHQLAIGTNNAVMEARDKVRFLRTEFGHADDLMAYLTRTGAELEKLHETHFTIDVKGRVRPFDCAVGNEMEKIIAEALINAFRHANATAVRLTIAFGWRRFVASVIDDGEGIDETVLAQGSKEGHWGVHGMYERAARVDARFSIRRMRSGGTEVLLVVPARQAYARRFFVHAH